MYIFTTEMIIQTYAQSREFLQMLVNSLLSAAGQNVIDFFPAFIEVIDAKDWGEACIRLLILAGVVLMIYRLARKMPFMALKSIGDMWYLVNRTCSSS